MGHEYNHCLNCTPGVNCQKQEIFIQSHLISFISPNQGIPLHMCIVLIVGVFCPLQFVMCISRTLLALHYADKPPGSKSSEYYLGSWFLQASTKPHIFAL